MAFRVALIDESRCIGCAKCLPACPTDAIVGAEHYLHTVITRECIGCELCLPPCPVDCIEMRPVAQQAFDSAVARQRVKSRKLRLQRQADEREAERARRKAMLKTRPHSTDPGTTPQLGDPLARALAAARKPEPR
ncbi:RnfABCDGE type electron transport complex subunit B [Solimonas terrae]|uniref:RnfABCDGE type electron transport complex subunit B n=2 Tax=Solimonas terrae TaxID=1396819 RepID=A0A6M2BP78_9GAMM|nr:RnfABCDGE type electron transport complex subunit B [Solimonas terrae]NGY04174.1 RnfABCDGE type electron transport complex subunit B [Solimonas terrae]